MDFHCPLCREAWSTQGLHWTTSDLDWPEFFDLIRGKGCPCCSGNVENRPLSREERLDQLGRLEENGYPAGFSWLTCNLPRYQKTWDRGDLLDPYRNWLTLGGPISWVGQGHWSALKELVDRWGGRLALGDNPPPRRTSWAQEEPETFGEPNTLYLKVIPWDGYWYGARHLHETSEGYELEAWASHRAFEEYWKSGQTLREIRADTIEDVREVWIPIGTLIGPHSPGFRPTEVSDYLKFTLEVPREQMVENLVQAWEHPEELDGYEGWLEQAHEKVEEARCDRAREDALRILADAGVSSWLTSGGSLREVTKTLLDAGEAQAVRRARSSVEPAGYTYLVGRVNPDAILAVPTLWFDTLEDITGPLRGILLLKGEGPQWVDNLPAGEFVREGSRDVSSRTYMELPTWAREALWDAKGESF